MDNSRRKTRKSMKKRKTLYTVLVISMVLLSGIIVFAINLTLEAKNAASKMYVPLEGDEKENSTNLDHVKIEEAAFTILLAGIERQEEEKNGRSDMLIVVTVNPNTEKISMVSIPRDTMVYIDEIGRKEKINHAYSYGGMNYTINTLEKLLDIPIDYYVSTDFQGFQDIVDTVGGVDVDVPFTVKIQLADTMKWKTYTKGPMHLQGNEALAYVRMRKKDPEGDKGRNTRQKQVIQDIINKATSVSNITKVDDMIKDVGENVKTNIPSSEYFGLMKMYQKIKTSPIEQFQLEGYDERIYSEIEKQDIWYFFPHDDSLIELKEKLKLNLEGSEQNAPIEVNHKSN
ncbi:LCP family protein [Psychrobacillus vulpis]|uniref:Transcriptional regulator n=1 Tax=Psychrobacillus vulpis TaxID=2325572 RepID=A0A544TPQ2_9BACI|nr:LCP family protein [Psychrobacillus vulpis]TQR19423.1 transcriptional regulator [Psychrobacillus vulpis]